MRIVPKRYSVRVRRAAGAWLVLAPLLLAVACGPEPRPNAPSGSTNPPEKTGSASPPTSAAAAAKANWVRFGYDPARSGVNPEEIAITRRTVAGLRLLWRTDLPEVADSSPILLHDLEFPRARATYSTRRPGTAPSSHWTRPAARSSGATGPPAPR